MGYIPTGLARLDRANAGLDFCLRDLRRAIQDRDLKSARGCSCLIVQKLAQHFSDEEEMMRTYGWSHLNQHAEVHGRILDHFTRFERRLAVAHVMTLDLSYLALINLPEVLRVHQIASDFGFAKFAITARTPRASSTVLRLYPGPVRTSGSRPAHA